MQDNDIDKDNKDITNIDFRMKKLKTLDILHICMICYSNI